VLKEFSEKATHVVTKQFLEKALQLLKLQSLPQARFMSVEWVNSLAILYFVNYCHQPITFFSDIS
jgi:hypothetical protein